MENKSLGDKIVIIGLFILFLLFISLVVVNEFNIVEEKIKNYLGWIFWSMFLIWTFSYDFR